jgi:hypothetical protein
VSLNPHHLLQTSVSSFLNTCRLEIQVTSLQLLKSCSILWIQPPHSIWTSSKRTQKSSLSKKHCEMGDTHSTDNASFWSILVYVSDKNQGRETFTVTEATWR